jgi:FkbM family methyltransferase
MYGMSMAMQKPTRSIPTRIADKLGRTRDQLVHSLEKQVYGGRWNVSRFTHEGRTFSFALNEPRDYIQSHIMQGQFYELDQLEIVRPYAQNARCIADIGSNIGNHAVYFAAFTNCERIIPFEVNPALVPVLKSNLAMNCPNKAVWDQIGTGLGRTHATASLNVIDERNLGGARLQSTAAGAGTLKIVPGDDILLKHDIDFIKIDVEGMEMDVLAGLEQTLTKHRPTLFVEVEHINRAEFDALLARHKYETVQTFSRYEDNVNVLARAR